MAKLTRFNEENACYHVTAKTKDNRPIFQDDECARMLLSTLDFVRAERAFVLGFVVMPDHLHVLLVPRGDQTISSVMRTIKGYSSRSINAESGGRGSLWQSSFHDRAIRDERQLRIALEYVHANPVKAGIVASPEEYPYSSAYPGTESDIEEYLVGFAETGKSRLR